MNPNRMLLFLICICPITLNAPSPPNHHHQHHNPHYPQKICYSSHAARGETQTENSPSSWREILWLKRDRKLSQRFLSLCQNTKEGRRSASTRAHTRIVRWAFNWLIFAVTQRWRLMQPSACRWCLSLAGCGALHSALPPLPNRQPC